MAKRKSTKQAAGQVDVSLLLPVWNGVAHYPEGSLRRAIESALNQDGVSVEICVCDDGSDDETLKLLDDYPVKLVRSERVGVGEATNKAAALADGRYMMQYSARAHLAEDGLKRMVDGIKGAGFVYGPMRVYGEIERLHVPKLVYKRHELIANFIANFFMFQATAWKLHGLRFRDYVTFADGNAVGMVDRDFMMQMMVDLGWDGQPIGGEPVVHYYYGGDKQGSKLLDTYRRRVMLRYNELWRGAE